MSDQTNQAEQLAIFRKEIKTVLAEHFASDAALNLLTDVEQLTDADQEIWIQYNKFLNTAITDKVVNEDLLHATMADIQTQRRQIDKTKLPSRIAFLEWMVKRFSSLYSEIDLYKSGIETIDELVASIHKQKKEIFG